MDWRLENGNLHIGETIETEYCTLPSCRYTYPKEIANKLRMVSDGDICYVYAIGYPLVDIWNKYLSEEKSYAGCFWKKKFVYPEDIDVWQCKLVSSYAIALDTDGLVEASIQYLKALLTDSPKHKLSDVRQWGFETSQKTMNEYTAVYSNTEIPFIDFFKEENFIFRVRHNEYRVECKIIEFYVYKGELLCLINDNHSQLSFYNMKGEVVATYYGPDDFYTKIYLFDTTLVAYGWIWSPFDFMRILDIEKIMEGDPNYEGLDFDYDSSENVNNLVPPHVCAYKKKAYTTDEYLQIREQEKKEEIAMYIAEINTLWQENNILRDLLQLKTGANLEIKDVEIQEILDTSVITSFSCKGGKSGLDLQYYCKPILEKELVNNAWKDGFPNIIKNNKESRLLDAIVTMVYQHNYKYFAKPKYEIFNLAYISLVYEINQKWCIKFVVSMDPIEGTKYYKPPKDDTYVNVEISYIKN
jgi:hypothetical protein